jgi:hypothetical protein
MDEPVALHRLDALLEGLGVDALCQLCLVELETTLETSDAPPTADVARCAHQRARGAWRRYASMTTRGESRDIPLARWTTRTRG